MSGKMTPRVKGKKQSIITQDTGEEVREYTRAAARKVLGGGMSQFSFVGEKVDDVSPYEMAKRIIDDNEGISVADAIMSAMAVRAVYFGDVSAGTFLRDSAGEKPREKTEVDNKIEVSFSMELTGGAAPLSANNPIEILPENINEVKDAEN